MAASYVPHRGHRSTDYTINWLGRWAELRLLGVPSGVLLKIKVRIQSCRLRCNASSVDEAPRSSYVGTTRIEAPKGVWCGEWFPLRRGLGRGL